MCLIKMILHLLIRAAITNTSAQPPPLRLTDNNNTQIFLVLSRYKLYKQLKILHVVSKGASLCDNFASEHFHCTKLGADPTPQAPPLTI